MATPILLKKVSIKSIMGIEREADTKKVMTELAQHNAEICAITGKITGYGQKATQLGVSTFFVGAFVAQNRQNGKMYKGSTLYLPKDVSERLVATFDQRNESDSFIKFDCVITVVPHDGQGFTYVTEGIKDAQAVTDEAEMIGRFASLPPPKPVAQLEAPKSGKSK